MLNLKLVHVTDRLLNEYLQLVRQGRVRMPELSMGTATQFTTEES